MSRKFKGMPEKQERPKPKGLTMMKNQKMKALFFIAVEALCILASLTGTLVCESKLPYMTKYSFVMILIVGVCILLALMLNAYERISEQLRGNSFRKKEEELQAIQKELKEIRRQNEELKSKTLVSPQNSDTTESPVSDTELLRKKCETIESFRNSFPYQIADGYILYNVMRTEIQVSGFSRWQLVGEFDNQLWEYTLLRPDTQSYKEMLSLAASTKEPAELCELNVSKQLLWN